MTAAPLRGECNGMPATIDEALVLRLADYSETSQIATLFSADHGLLRLIAKGARRSTKQRFAAGLDLLERGEVAFVTPRGDAQLGTLTDWQQRDTFAGLRRDLLRLHGALYAAETTAGLTEEGDATPALYAALVRTLAGLARTGSAARWVPWFQRELLRAIGYAPSFRDCIACGKNVQRSQVVYFSAAAGGLLCRDCEPAHVEKKRVPPSLLRLPPAETNPADWFDLQDYHLTHLAGRRFRTAEQVARLLRREPRPSL